MTYKSYYLIIIKLITPENKNDTLKMRYKSNKLDDMNQIKDKQPKYDLNESLAASDQA